MLAQERQSRMVQYIKQRLTVSVNELSEYFDVSAMTVRRDLELLEEKGLVERIHGGAMAQPAVAGLREEERAIRNVDQKALIGEMAARLVQDGQTIFIDAGTTTIELARRLLDRRGLTVVTNSVKVLSTLADAPGINLVGVGGTVYGGAWSFVGPLAEAGIRRFLSDQAFLGITGLSLEHGLSEMTIFEANSKSLIIQQSQRAVLLADSSKFEKVSPISVAPLSDIDVIITDDRLSPDLVSAYQQTGVELVLARENITLPGKMLPATAIVV
jgi:DeoR/GlpR family transcriptional regulator of sugar metabolism